MGGWRGHVWDDGWEASFLQQACFYLLFIIIITVAIVISHHLIPDVLQGPWHPVWADLDGRRSVPEDDQQRGERLPLKASDQNPSRQAWWRTWGCRVSISNIFHFPNLHCQTLIFAGQFKTHITFTFCCRAVKTHPFFNSINWSDLDKKRVTPPFKPQVWRTTKWRNSLLRVFARFPKWSLFRLSQTLTLATLTLSSLVSSKSFHRHCRCLFCTVLFMMIVMMATRWECRADATWPRLLPPDPKHLRGAGGGGPGLLQPGQQSQNGAYSAALHPFKMAFFIFGQIKNLTITTNILSVFVSRPQFCDGRGKSHVWKLIKVIFSDWRFWSSMSLFQIVWCSELGNRNPNNMESIFSLTKEAGSKTMEGSQM